MIAFNAEVNDPDGKFFENVAAVAHGVDLVAPQEIANKMEDLTPDARRAVMSFVMIEARMQDTFDKLNQMRYAGVLCMLFGFFFWFVMVQFHQDQLLRKSAKRD
ncbi:hypothetical protein SH528x_005325 [Novipirellula sp. SH528]|uniref:hypothetical protein n=1 Tax=Novipirellula sp. SH528 TaxID=3454466 RepID=UPI003FA058FF